MGIQMVFDDLPTYKIICYLVTSLIDANRSIVIFVIKKMECIGNNNKSIIGIVLFLTSFLIALFFENFEQLIGHFMTADAFPDQREENILGCKNAITSMVDKKD